MAATDPRATETRARLIAAGMALFGRHGYDGVTTRALAEAAGVNQAAIPYHYGGKEGVYRAVAQHLADSAEARIRPLAEALATRLSRSPPPVRDELEALLLQATLEVADAVLAPEHRDIWPLFLMREQIRPSAAFECLYAQFGQPLQQLMGSLLGALLGTSPRDEATVLFAHAYLGQILSFAAANSALTRWLGHRADPAAVRAAIERFARIAIAGMRAPDR